MVHGKPVAAQGAQMVDLDSFFSGGGVALVRWILRLIGRAFSKEPHSEQLAKSPIKPRFDTAAENKARQFIDVTPEYLRGLYKDHTDIQGQKLGEIYIGKWIKVSGPLGNVWPLSNTGERKWTKSKRTSQVTFGQRGPVTELTYVFMRFNEDWREVAD